MEIEIESQLRKQNLFLFILRTVIFVLLFSIVSVTITIFILRKPPVDFVAGTTVTIEPGANVSEIVEKFEAENLVRSGTLLQAVLAFMFDATAIKAGEYIFVEPLSVTEIAKYITLTGPNEPLISLTFPEGMTVVQFAKIAEESLPNFDVANFLTHAEGFEGMLFPETYFVPEHFTEESLLDLFKETYAAEIKKFKHLLTGHILSEDEVIILASIIEREANTPESMRLVSGVLQNRLEINMPLQADATIEYALDTPLNELPPGGLAVELRETDSPYNTYLNTGLPPTPIGNPGSDAIYAVLNPESSEYFYYITDNNGEFHFAKTLQEHNQNIAQYLR